MWVLTCLSRIWTLARHFHSLEGRATSPEAFFPDQMDISPHLRSTPSTNLGTKKDILGRFLRFVFALCDSMLCRYLCFSWPRKLWQRSNRWIFCEIGCVQITVVRGIGRYHHGTNMDQMWNNLDCNHEKGPQNSNIVFMHLQNCRTWVGSTYSNG